MEENKDKDLNPEDFQDFEQENENQENLEEIIEETFDDVSKDEFAEIPAQEELAEFQAQEELTEISTQEELTEFQAQEATEQEVNSIDAIEEDSVFENQSEFSDEAFEESFVQETFEEETKETQGVKAQALETSFPSVLDEEEVEEEKPEELITVRPVKFQEFEETPPIRTIKKNLDIMQDVMMHVSVELGRTKSSIREVIDMEESSIVELEKIAGEQVEVYVNDKFVAKGEVIVIEDKFGVRITSTNIPKMLD